MKELHSQRSYLSYDLFGLADVASGSGKQYNLTNLFQSSSS